MEQSLTNARLSSLERFAKQMVKDGALDSLMSLCVYFPAQVRTRAIERAIRSMAVAKNSQEMDLNVVAPLEAHGGTDEETSRRSSLLPPLVEEDDGEHSIFVMDEMFHVRLEGMQGLAAKCISVLAADTSSQTFLVDDPERIDRLVQLLYSNNTDVVKYASKTMAYLSLRNDRFKPNIVRGSGAAALLTVIWSGTGTPADHDAFANRVALSEAVSHSCCALANLATNTESQEILMSHLDLLDAACSVIGLFPHQHEIERHVARLIANLALYGTIYHSRLAPLSPVLHFTSIRVLLTFVFLLMNRTKQAITPDWQWHPFDKYEL
jgi:hypothetical protein